MTRFFLRLEIVFLTTLATFLLYAGVIGFWTDSEMWSTVVVKHLFSSLPYYDFKVKPLFSLLLYCNFHLAEKLHVHPMETARVFFAGNALLCAILFYRIAKRLSGRSQIAGILTALMVTNSYFIKRFSNVRSDLLATTAVLALFLLANSDGWLKRRVEQRALLVFAVSLVCLLLTPKSIFVLLFWAALFLWRDLPQWRRFLAAGAVAAGVIGVAAEHRSLLFFWSSFGESAGLPYWSWYRLEHVLRFLIENPLILLFWIFNLAAGLGWRARFDVRTRAYFDFSNLVLLLLLLFPDRLPFFIASLLPFWLLPLAAATPMLESSSYFLRHRWKRLTTLLVAYCFVAGLFWAGFLTVAHNSYSQRRFIDWLGGYQTALSELSVYDPVGILPFSNTAQHWFLGPSEIGNQSAFENLKALKIDVVFYTNKLAWLGRPLWDYLNENYWQDHAGIFVRKIEQGVTGDRLSTRDLTALIQTQFPSLSAHPEHLLYLRLLAGKDIDLSRFAIWHNSEGATAPFASQFSIRELESHEWLELPRTTNRVILLPIQIETPFSSDWAALFRFDTEI